MLVLPDDRMPEAEVALRFAFFLLRQSDNNGRASVAIDGAEVRVKERLIFPLEAFMTEHEWRQVQQKGRNTWQGLYQKYGQEIEIHARSGVGDVVAEVGAHRIRAECKGGPLIHKPGSKEYPILQKVIGQLVTIEEVLSQDMIVAVVPATDKFRRLADLWRDRPILSATGIKITLVHRNGNVEGLNPGDQKL